MTLRPRPLGRSRHHQPVRLQVTHLQARRLRGAHAERQHRNEQPELLIESARTGDQIHDLGIRQHHVPARRVGVRQGRQSDPPGPRVGDAIVEAGGKRQGRLQAGAGAIDGARSQPLGKQAIAPAAELDGGQQLYRLSKERCAQVSRTWAAL